MKTNNQGANNQINVFLIEQAFVFKHYFDGEEIFNRLKQYYNNNQYRFEVPIEDFESIKTFLEDRSYELIIIDSIEEYLVVVKKYTAHPDNIFKSSLDQRSINEYNCFLMKDNRSVERAITNGAIPLSETTFESPY